jgi:ribosomal protein S19E (S16A)
VHAAELRAKLFAMKHIAEHLAEPLSEIEAEVLRAYAQSDDKLIAEVTAKQSARKYAWAKAIQSLTRRGFIQQVDRGMLVTPEGLASLLDSVPIEVMRTASQSVAT